MKNDNKLVLGKILGEIYRLQKSSDDSLCQVSNGQVYALLNGFEHAVDEELEMIGFVSAKKVEHVMDILDRIWIDKERLDSFKGYYDIEHELTAKDVDRSEAIRIIKYLKANDQFLEVIEKMDSSGSPTECRRFKLTDWDV